MTLYDELKSFQGTDFRELYHRYVYIECKKLLEEMFPGEIDDEVTGLFAYGYIDATEGLSFRPFMIAKMDETTMQAFPLPHQENTMHILRLREKSAKMDEVNNGDKHMYLYAVGACECRYLDLRVLNILPEDFAEIKSWVDKNYSVSDDRELLRTDHYSFLDSFRNELYPDDVRVLLYEEANEIEQVWVRMMFVAEKEIFGELLNEPYQDYGCHAGDLIGFVLAQAGEDEVLLHTGHIAKQVENEKK